MLTQYPRPVFPEPDHQLSRSVFAFAPNRDTLGGTAYLVVQPTGNILVDCPAWTAENQAFLQAQEVNWLFITHRDGFAKVPEIQQQLGCQVVIQEQEAYLLPGVKLQTFQAEISLTPEVRGLWTPGYSPGSACLFVRSGGGILFSGRHLLPDAHGHLAPLKTAKTFHWGRQLRQVQRLVTEFNPETLQYLCPGANTGFLRGRHVMDNAYEQLAQIDLKSGLAAQMR